MLICSVDLNVLLCQVLALSCLKNFSAQSDLVLFCVSDNKRLELELEQQLEGDQCLEAISLLRQGTDKQQIILKI